VWDYGVIIRFRPLEGDIQDRRSLYYIPSVRLLNTTTDTGNGNGRLASYCFWSMDLIDGAWLGNRLGAEHDIRDTLRHLSFLCYLLESRHSHDFFICLSRLKVFLLKQLVYYSLLIGWFFYARELERYDTLCCNGLT